MSRARLERMMAEVATLKRNAPTSRLQLYDMGDVGYGNWSGGPVDCISLPRESESVTAWFASCNEYLANH